MVHFLLIHANFLFDHWFWHPLRGNGYQFWSGIAGSFLTAIPGWSVAGLLFFRHTTCHAPWCLRPGKFSLEQTPYKLCKRHHPDVPNKLTLDGMLNQANEGTTNGE